MWKINFFLSPPLITGKLERSFRKETSSIPTIIDWEIKTSILLLPSITLQFPFRQPSVTWDRVLNSSEERGPVLTALEAIISAGKTQSFQRGLGGGSRYERLLESGGEGKRKIKGKARHVRVQGAGFEYECRACCRDIFNASSLWSHFRIC